MITCHVCGSTNIRFLKQKRTDGVWVVTARCDNNHIPEKGKPFYPVANFDLGKLSPLVNESKIEQPELFTQKKPFEDK